MTAAVVGAIGTVVALLALWAGLTVGSDPIVRKDFLPSIPDTLSALGGDFQSVTMVEHAGASLLRFVVAAGAGTVVGLSLGMLMGFVPVARGLLNPITRIFQWLSPVLLSPLFLLWWGLGDHLTVLPAALVTASIVTWQTSTAMKEKAASHVQDRPAAVIGGVRVALPAAWAVIYFAEIIFARTGLGAAVWTGRMFFRADEMMAAALVAMLLAMAADGSLALLQRLAKRS